MKIDTEALIAQIEQDANLKVEIKPAIRAIVAAFDKLPEFEKTQSSTHGGAAAALILILILPTLITMTAKDLEQTEKRAEFLMKEVLRRVQVICVRRFAN